MRDQENILLASGSQRRRELLSWVTDRFEIIPSDIDESPLPGELPQVYCQRIAEQKALAIPSRMETQNSFVLAADTIVYSQNRIIGKPKDEQDAFQILTFLQGQIHHVCTAVTLYRNGKTVSTFCDTSVRIILYPKPLSDLTSQPVTLWVKRVLTQSKIPILIWWNPLKDVTHALSVSLYAMWKNCFHSLTIPLRRMLSNVAKAISTTIV